MNNILTIILFLSHIPIAFYLFSLLVLNLIINLILVENIVYLLNLRFCKMFAIKKSLVIDGMKIEIVILEEMYEIKNLTVIV